MTAEERKLHDIMWGVRRSIRYHTRRRAFYDRINLFASALGIIMGSIAVATALEKLPPRIVLAVGAITALVSAINLVVGSSRMARLHHDLVRQFSSLEGECLKARSPSTDVVVQLECERLRIEADEPPKLAVLDAMCHNELLIAEGRKSIDLAIISPLQRGLAQFWDWRSHTIRTRRQKAEEAAPLATPIPPA